MDSGNSGHQQKYPRKLFIQTLNDEGGEATTAEITGVVGCSDQTTRTKMHELEDDELVESYKVGPGLLWRLV